MRWGTLAIGGYFLGIQFGLIYSMNQAAMALRIPSKCYPEFAKHGSYTLDKCMAFCMMNLDEPACHGIDMDFGQQTCEHVTFNFTTISCLGNLLLTRNQTSSNEIYLKTEHLGSIHSIDRALYFANLEDGKMVPASNANESLVDLTFPKSSILNRIDISVEYQNGVVTCQVNVLKCAHWSFDADEYTPFPPLKRVHNQFEELAAFGSKLIVVGNTRTYDALESVQIYEPKTRDWVFGPDLLHARIMVAIVTLNSTSVMAVAGQIQGLSYSSKVEMLSIGDSNWTALADYPEPVSRTSCGTVIFPNGTNGVLCIGGKTPMGFYQTTNAAYFFDLANLEWKRAPEFDALTGQVGGRIVQWNHEIFYKPDLAGHSSPDPSIYVKDLLQTKKPWTKHEKTFPTAFRKIIPLKIKTFKLKP